MMRILVQKCIEKIANRPIVQRIMDEELDLSCIMRRPTRCEQFGIVLVLLSYVIGWPAVAFFGFLSVYIEQPLVLIICGPLIYGISHLVFIAGAYFAGKKYVTTFMKWSCKKFCEKCFAGYRRLPAGGVKF